METNMFFFYIYYHFKEFKTKSLQQNKKNTLDRYGTSLTCLLLKKMFAHFLEIGVYSEIEQFV